VARVTSPENPTPARPVAYKGEPLDAERGPGLGCFRFQLGLLLFLVILTPLTVAWGWPPAASAVLLFLTLLLLLFAGQTVIFLLRLVAAERGEGRRRPRASATRTVGELEDELATPAGAAATHGTPTATDGAAPESAAIATDAAAMPDEPAITASDGDTREARHPDPGVRE
jgi:hypothetical protein